MPNSVLVKGTSARRPASVGFKGTSPSPSAQPAWRRPTESISRGRSLLRVPAQGRVLCPHEMGGVFLQLQGGRPQSRCPAVRDRCWYRKQSGGTTVSLWTRAKGWRGQTRPGDLRRAAPGALWPVSSARLLSPPTGQGLPIMLNGQECSGAGQWVGHTLQLWRN